MVRCTAGGADTASAHTIYDLIVGDLQGDDGVKGDPCLFQSLGLRNGAGHAVQDKALLAVCLGQTLGDHADDHFIGDQLAGVHILLGLQTHGGAVLHGGPQDVAGGNGGNVELFTKDLCLGAFASTRRA